MVKKTDFLNKIIIGMKKYIDDLAVNIVDRNDKFSLIIEGKIGVHGYPHKEAIVFLNNKKIWNESYDYE